MADYCVVVTYVPAVLLQICELIFCIIHGIYAINHGNWLHICAGVFGLAKTSQLHDAQCTNGLTDEFIIANNKSHMVRGNQ